MCARKQIAVMQPYFYPYAGYFRLFAAADHFVILDTVQFPRRGRVHRCQLPDSDGENIWLTLPIEKCPVETPISGIQFHKDAATLIEHRVGRILSSFKQESGYRKVRDTLLDHLDKPVDYLSRHLRETAAYLGFGTEIIRSSELPDLRCEDYQDRIIQIVKTLGGTDYVNLPGGVDLYDAERFHREGIGLHFLTPYTGKFRYLIPALICASAEAIRADIRETTRFVDN